MKWTDLDWSPSSRVLRQFAGLAMLLLVPMAYWYAYQNQPIQAGISFALALGIGPLGLLRPAAIRPVYVAWMVMAFPIGWIVSHLVVALMFYFVLTPLAILFKLIGRDVLCRSYEPEQVSYWQRRPEPSAVGRYFHPY
jgi:hypothetical protein